MGVTGSPHPGSPLHSTDTASLSPTQARTFTYTFQFGSLQLNPCAMQSFRYSLSIFIFFQYQNYQTITMDKFCLKWNDFQINASKTFRDLRREEDFFDVTLVSDDEKHIAAHKLVLSASSEVFKNILRKASHSNPMIYLNGFNSKDLNLIIDYIYQGEVQILQSDLDAFLNVAQKLKIEGLIGDDKSRDETFNVNDEVDVPDNMGFQQDITKMENETEVKMMQQKREYKQRERKIVNSTSLVNQSGGSIDAKAAVDDLVEKTTEGWMCRTCGKITKNSSDIRRHAESHIEGLSFSCQLCDKTFRSRHVLANHKLTHTKC